MADGVYKIYKHTTPNNKVYIGLTRVSPTKRWNNGKNYKNNHYFYKAIEKYGWNNIKHEILCDKLTYEEACNKEIEYIDFYKSNDHRYGYNIMRGGLLQNDEIRKIMSKNNKNKKGVLILSIVDQNTSLMSNLYKYNGCFKLDIYDSISECAIDIGKSKGTIKKRINMETTNRLYKTLNLYFIRGTNANIEEEYGKYFLNLLTLREVNYLEYTEEIYYYLCNKWHLKDRIRIVNFHNTKIREMNESNWLENYKFKQNVMPMS